MAENNTPANNAPPAGDGGTEGGGNDTNVNPFAELAEATPDAEEIEESGEAEVSEGEQIPEAKPGDAKPATEAKPVAKPGEKPGEQTPAEQKPQEQAPAQEPAPKEGQPPAQEPAKPTKTPEQFAQEYRENRERGIKDLAEKHYKLPKEMADKLDPETAEIIPQLMSKVYYDSVEATTNALVQQLPTFIANVMQQHQAVQAAEKQFYESWPDLDAQKDREVVMRLATGYRQAHPQATVEQFIQEVGAMSMLALKRQGTQQQEQQEKPAANGAPVRKPQGKPAFKPAGTQAPTGPAKPANAFEQMAEEFLEEDQQY